MADSEHTSSSEERLARILERSAGLMQEAFLKFCENIWWRVIEKIDDIDGELVVSYREDFDHPFVPFDDTKISHLTNRASVKAAVCTQTLCDQSFMRMERLFKNLVRGMQKLRHLRCSMFSFDYYRHQGSN